MMENTYEKLQRTMNSYVPEFAYEHGGDDPGSVMTDLCGSMLEECRERYDRVLDKHYIQYLNLFESLLKEPVSASKGSGGIIFFAFSVSRTWTSAPFCTSILTRLGIL